MSSCNRCENPFLMMFILLTFIVIGYYFTLANMTNNKKTGAKTVEGFTATENEEMFKSCPTSLVKEGSKYYLFNKNIPKKDGVNPYVMDSLDEYVEFIEFQRSKGIDCPVLYIEGNYNAQGTKEYRVQRAPGKSTNVKPKHPPLTKLLDANRDSDVYNRNMFAGFDKDNLYIGEYTPLDERFHAFKDQENSPNAMDPNWGGAEVSQQLLAPQLEQRKTELSTDFTPKFIYEENRYNVRN
jgi:hypothetical protein